MTAWIVTEGKDVNTIHLGSRHVRRSASEVDTATAKASYMGICKRCPRPVRVDAGGDGSQLPRFVEIRCPDCAGPLRGERLFAVLTDLECDSSCMTAWGRACHCGCNGVNHARIWGKRLRECEELEGEIRRWKTHVAEVERRREEREEAKRIAEEQELAARKAYPSQLGTVAELIRHRDMSGSLRARVTEILRKVSAGEDIFFTEVSTLINDLGAAPQCSTEPPW